MFGSTSTAVNEKPLLFERLQAVARDDERVVLVITGDGLKTLDAVRDSFTAVEVDPNIESFEAAFAEPGVSV